MEELFMVYLKNSLQLSLLALLLWAATPVLARRYSAKCRYYLWAVLFAALLLPIQAKITLKLPESFITMPSQHITAFISETTKMTKPFTAIAWQSVAASIWMIGIFCFLGWHLLQHLFFLSSIKRWSDTVEDEAVLAAFTKTKQELKLKKNIALKSCAGIKTPMVIGLLCPTVLLPQMNITDELPLIIKHELVHYKRRDLWYKTAMLLVLSIHWFNPIVHGMVKLVLALCEISCDEKVLQGIDVKGRARYGETILGMIRYNRASKTAFSTNFHNGNSGIKKRIYAMMDMKKKRFSPVLLTAMLLIAVSATTAFNVSPVQAIDITQRVNQAMTSASVPQYTKIEKELVSSKVESSISEYQNSSDNFSYTSTSTDMSTSETRLIPIYE